MDVLDPLSDPPFSGTSFITDDLITEADPSSFAGLVYRTQSVRTVYDRRVSAWVSIDAYLFDVTFGGATVVEFQVNPEHTPSEAEEEARYYATALGRLPAFLFADLDTVTIHRGTNPFGGGNRNLLIHTGQGELYAMGGELEEILVHEAAHTSLDAHHAASMGWLAAQAADGVALSTYARDFPEREDIAESLGPYLAIRFRRDRIPAQTAAQIEAAIPNRIRYFDCAGLSMDLLP